MNGYHLVVTEVKCILRVAFFIPDTVLLEQYLAQSYVKQQLWNLAENPSLLKT